MKVQFITVTDNDVGQRLDNYLLKTLKGVPKSKIYRIIRKGEVRINKKRCKPETRLVANDEIRIPPIRMTDSSQKTTISPQRVTQLVNNILYEDKQLLIINKPTGLACHAGSSDAYGVVEILRENYPDIGLAHRLDKATSGCLVLAKNRLYLTKLQELWQQNQVQKSYLALVHGRWPQHVAKVDVKLDKNTEIAGERMVTVSEKGKTALTEFQIVEDYGKFYTLVRARPITGRMHQIRVHSAHLDHPIVGDEKYGCRKSDKITARKYFNNNKLGLLLHADSISFTAPECNQEILVKAELATDFQLLLDALDNN